MREAAIAAGTRIVASVFQPFDPQGVTGVVVVEESHLSIHTWPEYGYAAVDFFTCGEGSPEAAHRVLFDGLMAQRAEKIFVERGRSMTEQSMRLRSHTTEHISSLAGVGPAVVEHEGALPTTPAGATPSLRVVAPS